MSSIGYLVLEKSVQKIWRREKLDEFMYDFFENWERTYSKRALTVKTSKFWFTRITERVENILWGWKKYEITVMWACLKIK